MAILSLQTVPLNTEMHRPKAAKSRRLEHRFNGKWRMLLMLNYCLLQSNRPMLDAVSRGATYAEDGGVSEFFPPT